MSNPNNLNSFTIIKNINGRKKPLKLHTDFSQSNEHGEPCSIHKLPDGSILTITHVRHGIRHEYDRYFTMLHKDKADNILASFKYADDMQLYDGMNMFLDKFCETYTQK